MKLPILFFCCLFAASGACAQANDNATLLRFDGKKPRSFDDADYFMQWTKENDSLYVARYYRKNGPLMRWESYRDVDFDKPGGWFAWYNEGGLLDSSGYVLDGHKDWFWEYGNTNGRPDIIERWREGRFIERRNFITRMFTDSTGETIPFGEKDRRMAEERKNRNGDTVKLTQVPASFKGGIEKWTSYLSRNVNTPARLVSICPSGCQATVVVDFTISPTGKVDNIHIAKSVEWAADLEAIRVLKKSPDWIPAVQNGKNVVYRHRQSITYNIAPR